MRFISSKMHGMLDYGMGLLLMASPWLFGFSDVMTARWVAVGFGVMTILYSVFTRYELGIWRMIPFRIHLWLDVMSGVVLLAAPWFFGFAEWVMVPFVVFGLIEIITPLLTHRYADVPEEDCTSEALENRGNYTPVYNNTIQHH